MVLCVDDAEAVASLLGRKMTFVMTDTEDEKETWMKERR